VSTVGGRIPYTNKGLWARRKKKTKGLANLKKRERRRPFRSKETRNFHTRLGEITSSQKHGWREAQIRQREGRRGKKTERDPRYS